MFTPPIRWGILGTSYISEVMAKAIQESNSSQLVAIGSRSLSTAKDFSAKFSIPKCYNNYQQLLDDKDIDAIYIGLPNHLHKEWIIRSAQANKHILCEKPFVLNADEANEVISTLKKMNVFCMEALMYRCHPFTKKLQELTANNTIGEVKFYNATYTANIADVANPTAGGSIRNLGCYPISLVRLLAKAEPIEIKALGRMSTKHRTDNQASVLLQFANQAMAVISTADDIEKSWHFEMHGTKGNLKVLTNPWLPESTNKIRIELNDGTTPMEINVTAEKSLYTYQIDTVNNNIMLGNKKSHDGVSWEDSLGNIIVLENWLNQVSENKLA